LKIRQGEVYLVNFAKKYHSEFGKVRPALILQNDFLNQAIDENFYQSVLVVPFSTNGSYSDYKIPITARDCLDKESYCVCNWICTVDVK